MLLQGSIIAALLLGLLMAWTAGAVACFAAFTAWRPEKGWMKRLVRSVLLSTAMLALVFGMDAWTGLDDLSVFGYYLIGTMSTAMLSLVFLAVRKVQNLG